MNPKQLRGLLTLLLSGLGAVAVFFGVASYVNDVRAEVGPTTEVYVAAEDIGVYEEIDPERLDTVDVPEKYLTEQMITDPGQLEDQKATTVITAGSWLFEDMVEPTSSLEDGQREISINFEGDMGIHGRVQPGDRVDVVASFARDQSGDGGTEDAEQTADIPYNVAGMLVEDALVVSVGQPMDGAAAPGAASGGADPTTVVPVTFVVSVAEANRLAYGESFAVSMRMIRSGNNETGEAVTDDDRSFQDPDLGPNFSTPGEGSDDDSDEEAEDE
ncbi:Flp pilus assembly protein CpaB [Nesterenkonia alba]|uniref:Flp pilus assembly protein CpaB n=1 Tax=Nesterenkonia alba TaxID=515814 RepID=UPI0003B38C20|nr:Flp pilus assembly protein CpaB [Nesterenkonia alba]